MVTAGVLFLFSIVITGSALAPPEYSGCSLKDLGDDGKVCECSADYCDFFSDGVLLPPDQYAVYTSSEAGKRFELKVGKFSVQAAWWHENPSIVLDVNPSTKFQTVKGFGGAFTDAAALNILNVTAPLQQALLASYFSARGIEYTVGRVPMASCDFSTREYSYDDYDGDFALAKFALAAEDLKFKIPVIRAALNMSRREIALFGSPWSAPGWMKTSGTMSGSWWPGILKSKPRGKYHQTWALYFVKFIEAYAKHNITIWGLTVQNEPLTGFIPWYGWQTMGFTAWSERDFVKTYLGPTLAQYGHDDVRVMIADGQRCLLPHWANVILGDRNASQYVSGVAVHWYWDDFCSASRLTETHERFPDVFILPSEACMGSRPGDEAVKLGDWSRGNEYSHSIIEDVTHWASGWVDWNLALDKGGGPNWAGNFVDSPIIVDAERQFFYKQPMFYHLGHFSKFVIPGSRRIAVEARGETSLEFVGFLRPDSTIVIVVLNKSDRMTRVQITDASSGRAIVEQLPEASIQTFMWASENHWKENADQRRGTRPSAH